MERLSQEPGYRFALFLFHGSRSVLVLLLPW